MDDYIKLGLKPEEFDRVYYSDLKLLQNKTDLNQDFFENIFDVQNYKRVKAVTILTKRLTLMNNNSSIQNDLEEKAEELSVHSLKDIILPVLKYQILTKSLQENVLKASGTQITHAKTLVSHMIEAYSMCMKYFSWAQYFNIIKANITTLHRESKYEKVLVRLICANLNYLDGGLPNIIDDVTQEMLNQKNIIQDDGLMSKLVGYDTTKVKDFDDEADADKKNGNQVKQPTKKVQENGLHTDSEQIAVSKEVEPMNIELEAQGAQKEETKEFELLNAGTENANLQPVNLEEMERKENEKKLKDAKVLQITQQLRKKVLFPLRKHMHDLSAQDNKERKIRVYTAIAIAKVINILLYLTSYFQTLYLYYNTKYYSLYADSLSKCSTSNIQDLFTIYAKRSEVEILISDPTPEKP